MSPLPFFAAGQPFPADDANTLARQGVITVETTLDRDDLPAPHDGMVCFVEAENTYYVRVGGAWRVLWALDQSESVETLIGAGTVACTIRGQHVSLGLSISSAALPNDAITKVADIPAAFRPASVKGFGAYLSGYAGAGYVDSDGGLFVGNYSGAVRGSVRATVFWPLGS